MADGQGGVPPPDVRGLALDWITIWQSELAAVALDRELQEAWIRMVGLWAQAAERTVHMLPAPMLPGHLSPAGLRDSATGRAGTAVSPGAATAMAAPDARDATIDRLAERVAELERRLADLGGAGKPGQSTGQS